MNKYLWAECTTDYWPSIKTIMANSYNDAIDKIITIYGNKLDDDTILSTIENWEKLREYLNDTYFIALSDLEIYEEL